MSAGAANTGALLRDSAAAMGLELLPARAERLERFLEALLVWRVRTPLVSQRSAAEIIAKHVRDAFAVVPLAQGRRRIADLGSGAGFPGLVLAILCEDAEVALVESKRRKASFLREAVRCSDTDNARVVEARAENLIGEDAGPYHLVVSRAVWPTAEFLSLACPLLRPGGLAVAMKTPEDGQSRTLSPGYRSIREQEYHLGLGEKRILVLAEAE